MTGLSLRWTPPGPMAAKAMAAKAKVVGLMGPIGSGKSTTCIFRMLFSALQQPVGPMSGRRRARWAVIRNTYPELKTTTIKSWHQWVPQTMGQWQAEGPPTHLVLIDLPDGTRVELEVVFLALDRAESVSKLLSLELTGAWINEAREVPFAVLRDLRGRVDRFPPAADGGCRWAGIVMDTNPPDSDHWWYRLFEEGVIGEERLSDEERTAFALFRQPGGRSPAAENLGNLAPGYYPNASIGQPAEWRRVYIDAEYGLVQDGGRAVYPEYRDLLHCRPLMVVPGLPVWVGIDFGRTPAAVFGQKLPMGQWRWLDELCATNMGATKFGRLVASKLRADFAGYEVIAWTDPAGSARTQVDDRTPIKMIQAAGIPARPAPSNNWDLRRDAVGEALSTIIDGEPGLLIDPRCVLTRKGMAGKYAYRRIQVAGDARYEDEPIKNEWSHPCEAGQYMLIGGGEGKALIRPTQPVIVGPVQADGAYNPYDW